MSQVSPPKCLLTTNIPPLEAIAMISLYIYNVEDRWFWTLGSKKIWGYTLKRHKVIYVALSQYSSCNKGITVKMGGATIAGRFSQILDRKWEGREHGKIILPCRKRIFALASRDSRAAPKATFSPRCSELRYLSTDNPRIE